MYVYNDGAIQWTVEFNPVLLEWPCRNTCGRWLNCVPTFPRANSTTVSLDQFSLVPLILSPKRTLRNHESRFCFRWKFCACICSWVADPTWCVAILLKEIGVHDSSMNSGFVYRQEVCDRCQLSEFNLLLCWISQIFVRFIKWPQQGYCCWRFSFFGRTTICVMYNKKVDAESVDIVSHSDFLRHRKKPKFIYASCVALLFYHKNTPQKHYSAIQTESTSLLQFKEQQVFNFCSTTDFIDSVHQKLQLGSVNPTWQKCILVFRNKTFCLSSHDVVVNPGIEWTEKCVYIGAKSVTSRLLVHTF